MESRDHDGGASGRVPGGVHGDGARLRRRQPVVNSSSHCLAFAVLVEVRASASVEVSLREFRRRNWFLAEHLSRYMTVVCGAKEAEVLWVVGSAEGKWLDVIDLEIVGGLAFAA